jgi:hypothetical protein
MKLQYEQTKWHYEKKFQETHAVGSKAKEM